MSTAVLQLEESVKKLSHEEFSEFQRWFAEYEAKWQNRTPTKQQEWQDFVHRTAGMFADFPLERPEEGSWTKREEW